MKDRKDTKPRRPAQFWGPLNVWLRAYQADKGIRPGSDELLQWYNQNADELWGDDKPNWKDMKDHAKCLRSQEELKNYFRDYRAKRNAKLKATSQPGRNQSPECSSRQEGLAVDGAAHMEEDTSIADLSLLVEAHNARLRQSGSMGSSSPSHAFGLRAMRRPRSFNYSPQERSNSPIGVDRSNMAGSYTNSMEGLDSKSEISEAAFNMHHPSLTTSCESLHPSTITTGDILSNTQQWQQRLLDGDQGGLQHRSQFAIEELQLCARSASAGLLGSHTGEMPPRHHSTSRMHPRSTLVDASGFHAAPRRDSSGSPYGGSRLKKVSSLTDERHRAADLWPGTMPAPVAHQASSIRHAADMARTASHLANVFNMGPPGSPVVGHSMSAAAAAAGDDMSGFVALGSQLAARYDLSTGDEAQMAELWALMEEAPTPRPLPHSAKIQAVLPDYMGPACGDIDSMVTPPCTSSPLAYLPGYQHDRLGQGSFMPR